MLCYVMLCYVMLCYVMLCYVMLCYVMLCYVMLCYVMLCYVMLCYVMLCYVMLCYVMLCYVMLCYVMLCYVLARIARSETNESRAQSTEHGMDSAPSRIKAQERAALRNQTEQQLPQGCCSHDSRNDDSFEDCCSDGSCEDEHRGPRVGWSGKQTTQTQFLHGTTCRKQN